MPPDDSLKGYSPPVHVLAGTTGEEWRSDADLLKRLRRLSSGKTRSRAVMEYIQGNPLGHAALMPVAEGMRTCGNDLVFRHFLNSGESRLRLARTCKVHLLCGFCAVTRGSKALKVYLEKADLLLRGDGALRPYLVTFTIKNGSDLGERFNHLQDSLRLHRRRVSRGNAASEWSKCVAGVWSFEVVKGEGSGLWHPHVHCVWLCREAPDQAKLQDEWRAITGDSFMVDARPISEPFVEGFAEVFKYAVKLGDLAIDDQISAYTALRGRRLISSSGAFREVFVDPEAAEEMLPDPFYYDILLRYQAEYRGYGFDRVIFGA